MDTPGPAQFRIGELFEDCRFEPMICISVSIEDDELIGISLIDGRGPVGCSLTHCGPEPITIAQAVWIKQNFTQYVAHRRNGLEISEIIPTSTHD